MKAKLDRERLIIFLSLAVAILFGAYLRLRNISENSLWLDELFSIGVSKPDNSFYHVYQRTLDDFHPPFYQIVLWLFYKAFGFGEMVGRYLSAAFGILLIPAMFVFGRQTFNARVGLYAAWLAAINFFLITYSQETRSYALLALLTIVSFITFVRAMETLDWVDVFLYSIVAALLANTHYFGILVVLAQAMLVLVGMLESPWDNKRMYRFALACLFILLCVAPQASYIYLNFNRKSPWIPPPNDHFFIELFRVFFGGEALSVLAAALLVIAVAQGTDKVRKAKWISLFAIWLLMCTVIPYLRSLYAQPILTMRNLIVVLPAILMLLAFALSLFRNPWGRRALGVAILCFSMTPLFTEFKPTYTLENQLKPVSQMRDVVKEVMNAPTLWPTYTAQRDEFRLYLSFLGSSLEIRGLDQLEHDLLSSERPANFYFLLSRLGSPIDERFISTYGVELLKERKLGDSMVFEFHSLDRSAVKNGD